MQKVAKIFGKEKKKELATTGKEKKKELATTESFTYDNWTLTLDTVILGSIFFPYGVRIQNWTLAQFMSLVMEILHSKLRSDCQVTAFTGSLTDSA